MLIMNGFYIDARGAIHVTLYNTVTGLSVQT